MAQDVFIESLIMWNVLRGCAFYVFGHNRSINGVYYDTCVLLLTYRS